ncbi:MAG: hypothetical protein ACTSUW_05400 [Candidatus Heimdallarchaeota archaeon]
MLKVPLYFSFVTGAVGSYLGDRPGDSAKEIIPRFRPLNKIRGYWEENDPIPDYAKHIIQPTNSAMPGIQKSYVIITEDSNGQHPWLDKVLTMDRQSIAKLKKENEKLRRQIEQLELKIREIEDKDSKKRAVYSPYPRASELERYA